MLKKLYQIIHRLFQGPDHEQDRFQENELILERGEVQKIFFPEQLDENLNYKIIKWHVNTGAVVNSGDTLCEIQNEKNESMVFESFLKGRLQYKFPEKQMLKKNSTIAKIGSLQ